uniref:Tyrosinase copper-binding domain-containing protein n=1 Tax=Acrobeloides nanus TaxID=290746 RepID=A0A914CJV7_9BILA
MKASFYIFLNIFNIFILIYCFETEHDYQISCEEASSPVFKRLCYQLQRLHNRRENNQRPDTPPPKCDTSNAHDCAKPGTPIWEEIVGVDQAKLPDQTTLENSEILQECQDFKCLCNSFYLAECFKSSRNANQKFDCMRKQFDVNYPNSQSCILPNGKVLKKAYRKEYRMLSDEERTRFHNALNRIKQNKIYDHFHALHYHYSYGGGAHSGPAFVVWHREFIKRFEIALREVDPEVSLPYWDSTMDSILPEPKDSILWTADFLGSVNAGGNLTSGPFKDWITLEGNKNINRVLGMVGNSLIQEINVTTIINNRDMNYVFGDEFTPNSTCSIRWNRRVGDGMLVEKTLESVHAGVHIYVGGFTGDMGEFQTAVGDPVFFLLHSFIDHIWELWRQAQQSPSERETSFRQPDQNCHLSDHFIDSNMRPFKYQTEYIKNRDGLSNKYTDEFYEYAPRPTCRQNLCGSKYLFCDHGNIPNHCVSKIKVGGNCSGFYDDDSPCYNGWCRNNQDNKPCDKCKSGTCVAGRNPSTIDQSQGLSQSERNKEAGLTQESSQIVSELRRRRPTIAQTPPNTNNRQLSGNNINEARQTPLRGSNMGDSMPGTTSNVNVKFVDFFI